MNSLKLLLNRLLALTEDEWDVFSSYLKEEEFKPKSILIREGELAQNIYFIESGLLRTYHLLNGKEVNTYFACDEQFISTFSSFITQSPSFEYLEAIEESTVYALSFSALSQLYQKSPKFEKLGRILAEKNYLCILDRTLTLQTQTAKEKYLGFIENYAPKIVQRVPQHQIASFLGIAPESLSRVRRELVIS